MTESPCDVCGIEAAVLAVQPCGHCMCGNCIDALLQTDLLKMDSSSRCPACRSYIEDYKPQGRVSDLPLPAMQAFAEDATALRKVQYQQKTAAQAMKPNHYSPHATVKQWECSQCQHLNIDFTVTCCKTNCPGVSPVRGATDQLKKKDMMQCNLTELLQITLCKGETSLDDAFTAAGFTFSQERKLQGNVSEVEAAFKDKTALHKLRRLAKGIAKGQFVHTLAYHWFASHKLQHLIQAANTHRVMALHFEVHSNTKREQDDDQRAICSRVEAVLHGQDNLLGVLIPELCKVGIPAALDYRGTYVMQCALESALSAGEVFRLADVLLPVGDIAQATALFGSISSLTVLAKLVEHLTTIANKHHNLYQHTKTSSSIMKEEEAITAAKHLVQVCVLYNTDTTRIYVDSEPHEALFLDMLLSAVMGAAAMMTSGFKLTVTLAADKLVNDLQLANKEMYVLRALLLLDVDLRGSSGGDLMISRISAATEPEFWMYCLAAHQEHGHDLPDVEALLLKLHQLAKFSEASMTLTEMVKHIYIIEKSVYSWMMLKGLLRLPGFADKLIHELVQAVKHLAPKVVRLDTLLHIRDNTSPNPKGQKLSQSPKGPVQHPTPVEDAVKLPPKPKPGNKHMIAESVRVQASKVY